jgi:hypothetical protein
MSVPAAITHKPFELTPEQVSFFNLFGYLVLPDMFTDEMAVIEEEYEKVFRDHATDVVEWKHQAHYGHKRLVLPQFIDRSEYLSSLIDDPRIHNVFSGLLGMDFDYRGSDANKFEQGTVWHSDTYGALFKYLNVKIALYLEEIDEKTGCFRMIPGSHMFGDEFANKLQDMLGENDSLKEELGLGDIDIPAQVIPSKPGDMVVFDFRTKHATCFEGEAFLRRSFTICGSNRIEESDLPKLRKEIKQAEQFGYYTYYGEAMVRTAGPDRMVHLEQCLAQEDVFSRPESDG